MMVAFSVIIPVYNDEIYIKECLDSLKKQTFKNFEIICINDGSTDGTQRVLESYALNFPKFKIINQKNKCLSIARNNGLKEAIGEYIYFVDSDDILKENALEVAWNKCKEFNLDVLFFSFENFSNSEAMICRYAHMIDSLKRKCCYAQRPCSGQNMLVEFNENNEYYVTVWAQIARKEFLKKNKIQFYPGILFEDNLYTMQVLLKSEKVMCINDILYGKRIRENSIVTRKENAENIKGFLITVIEMLKIQKEIRYECQSVEQVVFSIIEKNMIQVKKRYERLEQDERQKLKIKLNNFERHVLNFILSN